MMPDLVGSLAVCDTGGLLVALVVTAFQIVALMVAALARGIDFNTSTSGIVWFLTAAILLVGNDLRVGQGSPAACRSRRNTSLAFPRSRSCRGSWPVLCSRSARSRRSSCGSQCLPITHALALMRYGLLSDSSGLHDIWGMANATTMASLSLLVVAVFAAALSAISVRVFAHAALH